MCITLSAIWHHRVYKENGSMFSFITILDAVLCLVLLGFNVWNWWLACTGYTTVEFFMAAAEAEGINIEEIDYSF
jgi:hypothetical protein